MDGAGGEQQRGNFGGVAQAAEGGTRRGVERDLGQCPGPPWRGGAGVPEDAWPGAAAGEPPFSRGQALPGYSPDFNADEAVWGRVREESTGNLGLGTKAAVPEMVGNFLAGLASRRAEVRRRCRAVLQSKAEGLLRSSQPSS